MRDMALLCLGLSCLIDIHMARGHLLLFLQVIYKNTETFRGSPNSINPVANLENIAVLTERVGRTLSSDKNGYSQRLVAKVE